MSYDTEFVTPYIFLLIRTLITFEADIVVIFSTSFIIELLSILNKKADFNQI